MLLLLLAASVWILVVILPEFNRGEFSGAYFVFIVVALWIYAIWAELAHKRGGPPS